MQNKIAITSGGIGDIVISIPVMRKLGIGTLYIKESYYPDGSSMYSVSKSLLETQGFRVEPTKDEGKGFDNFEAGVKYDINMDAWRNIPGRGRDYIMLSMMKYWNAWVRGWQQPWITNLGEPAKLWREQHSLKEYTLFFLTWRWRNDSKIVWKNIYERVSGTKYFIGIQEDYEFFCREVGSTDVIWFPTANLLEMAYLILGADDCYSNQSVFLALCHALGVHFNVEIKPTKTNCRIYTKWETILK